MIILLKLRPKTKDIIKNKDIIKTETETETETKTGPCWVCGDNFENQIGLQTHMNKHMKECVMSTEPSSALLIKLLNQALIKDSYILLSRVVILMILMSL